MGKYSLEDIKTIILTNPNKKVVEEGKEWKKRLTRHVHGVGKKDSVVRDEYFENQSIYNTRKENAVSNRDLFSRLLHDEEMVFTARGGSSRFGLEKDNEQKMNMLLEDIRFGQPLRKWIKNFALNAYRTDPMGLIFMEVESTNPSDPRPPRCYPTYKSIDSVYDYCNKGRQLEYVCFQLTVAEAKSYGVNDPAIQAGTEDGKPTPSDKFTNYFRFVDDEKDIIVKRDNGTVLIAANVKHNPVKNQWDRVPAFIVSDLIQFDNPRCFASPLQFVVELADCFFYDRSIRDLQKKYHGFAKAVEPLLQCPTCEGEGLLKGSACPSCTLSGQDKGSGYKLQTKVSDKAMFPLSILETGSFDFKRIFGYVTPDIESWNKQDLSLEKGEELIYFTYWGVQKDTSKVSGPNGKVANDGSQETATKTLKNLQPKYARLNATADWAEKTEKMIVDFIGEFWFDTAYRGASINYSRNYILELPEDILNDFYEARKNGLPQTIIRSLMDKYISSLDNSNPLEAEKKRKMVSVEPFPYSSISEVENSKVIPVQKKLEKWFFSEWESAIKPVYAITKDIESLRTELSEYVKKMGILPDNSSQLKDLEDKLGMATSDVEKKAIQRRIDQLKQPEKQTA